MLRGMSANVLAWGKIMGLEMMAHGSKFQIHSRPARATWISRAAYSPHVKPPAEPAPSALLDLPSRLYQDCLGLGSTMRGFCLIFACVTLGGVTACEAAPKIDLTPVTSSPLPSMQKYNGYVGKDYWLTALLRLCEGPSSLHCLQFLQPGTRVKVDGLVPNHSEVAGTSIDDPYFHIAIEGGRSGFVSAVILTNATTNVDPVTAAAECKTKGNPKLGMTAAQVKASCWGSPVN